MAWASSTVRSCSYSISRLPLESHSTVNGGDRGVVDLITPEHRAQVYSSLLGVETVLRVRRETDYADQKPHKEDKKVLDEGRANLAITVQDFREKLLGLLGGSERLYPRSLAGAARKREP